MSVNEIDRLVIVVPGGTGGMGLGETYVGVAIDKGVGGRLAESVMSSPSYAYSLIGRVCDGRAVQAVGGELLVQGKKVMPEKYIGMWREALAHAVSPQEAAEKFGVQVSLVVRGNLTKQAGQASGWTTDPMDNFDGWSKRFEQLINADSDGYFEFELDLRQGDAFRDWSHMTRYRDYKDEDPRNKPEMRVKMVTASESDKASACEESETAQVQCGLFA